jgi:hypothetical protein
MSGLASGQQIEVGMAAGDEIDWRFWKIDIAIGSKAAGASGAARFK